MDSQRKTRRSMPLTSEHTKLKKLTTDLARSACNAPVNDFMTRQKSPISVSSEEGLSPGSYSTLKNQLESNLSVYWTVGVTDGRCSRYGRRQKVKHNEGFIPTDVARFITKGMPKFTPSSPPSSSVDIRKLKTPTFDEIQQIKDAPNCQSAEIIENPPNLSELKESSDVDSGRGSSIDFSVVHDSLSAGSVVWAKFTGRCWWPCLVVPKIIEEEPTEQQPSDKVSVRFFADNGRCAWMSVKNLLPYQNISELEKQGVLIDKKRKNLLESITEADKYMSIPIDQRVGHFEAEIKAQIDKLLKERALKAMERQRNRKVLSKLRSPTPESPAYEDETTEAERTQMAKTWEELHKNSKKRRRSSQASEQSVKKLKLNDTNEPPPPPKVVLTVEEKLIRDFLTEDFDPSYLYSKPVKKEAVCEICYKPPGDLGLVRCMGGCFGVFHKNCNEHLRNGEEIFELKRNFIGLTKTELKKKRSSMVEVVANQEIIKEETVDSEKTEDENFCCFYCEANIKFCFNCHEDDTAKPLISCSYPHCGRNYHKTCLTRFPQASITGENKLTCPQHSCHTCFSADMSNRFFVTQNKLVQCIYCPTAYHYNSPACIVAGTEFITSSKMICIKHPLGEPSKINANWCFVCSKGGDLICCERCPTAIHSACIQMTNIPDNYICEQCEAGQLPLWNDIVWAKMGSYRFWPAICLPPSVIPLTMLTRFHAPNDVCVRFFGSNDYAWLATDRIFAYEVEDSEKGPNGYKNCLDAAFNRALRESQMAFNILQKLKLDKRTTIGNSSKPPPYIRIRTSVPVPPVKLHDALNDSEGDLAQEICSCQPESSCGINSDCLNRQLMQECDPSTCPCAAECQNQIFTRRQSPKMDVRHAQNRGFGLYAGEDIPEGSFIIEYVGEVIDVAEYRKRIQKMNENNQENYYFMTLKGNLLIDAGVKGNAARFINHSCDPNCMTQKWRVGNTLKIGLFATKNIQKDEEFTFDYQFECIGANMKPCCCGTKLCSGYIGMKKPTEPVKYERIKNHQKFKIKFKKNRGQKTSRKRKNKENKLGKLLKKKSIKCSVKVNLV